jgi:hypothetical protein
VKQIPLDIKQRAKEETTYTKTGSGLTAHAQLALPDACNSGLSASTWKVVRPKCTRFLIKMGTPITKMLVRGHLTRTVVLLFIVYVKDNRVFRKDKKAIPVTGRGDPLACFL